MKAVMKNSCMMIHGNDAQCTQSINAYACPGGIDVSGGRVDTSGNPP
jgi:hypothetical protein